MIYVAIFAKIGKVIWWKTCMDLGIAGKSTGLCERTRRNKVGSCVQLTD